VDVLATEYRDPVPRHCPELRGLELFPERRPWVDVILDELIVPVFTGWHFCIGAGDLGSDLFAGRLSYQVLAYGDLTVELGTP
jgi:hypothetical protein